MAWFLYILRCGDGTLYTGITDDVARRLAAHRQGKGAKYTRGRGPLELLYRETLPDRSAALRRERAVKALSRSQKLELIRCAPPHPTKEAVMMRALRRKDRAVEEEDALAVVDASPFGTLAAAGDGGVPYCVPLNLVREGRTLYFHCAGEGYKTDCLRLRPQVCLSFVRRCRVDQREFTTRYDSATVFGAAREITEEAEKRRALELLCRRFAPQNPDGAANAIARGLAAVGVWAIDITSLSGKRNP